MKNGFLLCLICLSLAVVKPMWADNSGMGADNFEMHGGKRGKVPFPHRVHQEKLEDCMACHSMFEQKSGEIERLKSEKKLKKKKVMNALCIKCHKKEKRAGNKAGPTKCNTCHIK